MAVIKMKPDPQPRGLRGAIQQLIFWEILQGMWLTFKYMFTKTITMHYPDERWVTPERFRGQVALVRSPQNPDEDLCVGCCLCVRVCPSGAIDMVTSFDEQLNKKRIDDHIINIARCIYCGMCAEVCPVNALINTGEYELSTYERSQVILHKQQLLECGANWRKKRQLLTEKGIGCQSVLTKQKYESITSTTSGNK